MASSIKKEGRKGQFTVFVILGFVILIVILFAIFTMSSIAEDNFRIQARTTVNDFLEASNVDYYVYTCVDAAVNEAVNRMAMQGGVFYKELGGNYTKTVEGDTHIPVKYIFGNREIEFNVSYGIINSSMCETVVYEEPPLYPVPETKIGKYPRKYNVQYVNVDQPNDCIFDPIYKMSGVVGHNNISRLCYIGSPNSDTSENEHLFKTPCQRNNNLIRNNTIEDELAKQIGHGISNCTDFSVFDIDGHNITLKGDPVVNLFFNLESFDAEILFPFEVKLKNKEPVLVRHAFEYSSDLRIPRIQNYLLRLLKEEVQNVTFNLTTDYYGVEGFDPSFMNVRVFDVDDYSVGDAQEIFSECNDCDYKYDRVVVVQDEQSTIGNQSLFFFSGVQNRRPVLDYIRNTSQDNYYDIMVIEDDTIVIEPWGVDPDEKEIFKYTYTGWKETHDEVWDFARLECQPGNIVDFTFEGLRNCVIDAPIPNLNKWTTSVPYVGNEKDAEYQVLHEDTGPHLLNITVADESGLIDYQEIKILVIDKPQIDIKIDPLSLYPLQDVNFVSIEDPFKLTTVDTTLPALGPGSGTMKIELFWESDPVLGSLQLIYENEIPFANQADVIQSISVPDDADVDIRTIRALPIDEVGKYIMKVSLFLDGVTDPFIEEKELFAEGCIPYHPPGISNAYPYAGGDVTSSAFRKNHTCCAGDITDGNSWFMLDGWDKCYEGDWSGEKEQLKSRSSGAYYTTDLNPYFVNDPLANPPPAVPLNAAGAKNDIYGLTYDRYCDGVRGNICAGDVDATLSKLLDCNPLPGSVEPDGMCSGPPTTVQSGLGATCQNYVGNTFESLFEGGDRVCNDDFKCSSINVYDDPAGKRLCQATCDGIDGCKKPYTATCRCQEGSCGARCDDPSDFEWNAGVCSFGCQSTFLCGYINVQATKCVNPTANNKFTGTASCKVIEGGVTGCYTDVKCTATGPEQSDFQRCQKGAYTDAATGDEMCMFGGAVPTCSAAGCNLATEEKPLAIWCPFGNYVCKPDIGWDCV